MINSFFLSFKLIAKSRLICLRLLLCKAGLTIVPVVPWEGAAPPGAPDQLPVFLPRCFNV